MTERISAADQLVILLRQRLAEHSQARRKTAERPTTSGRRTAPAHAIQAIVAADGLGDRALKRAIVQNLLAEQFGADLINDAQFQQMVDKVTDTLVDHRRGAELLNRLVAEIRGAETS